jgi:redox-sensitive bicupin YhaK (pirin superfamily)
MPATLFTNESRGGGNYDWLRTKYSYSFSNYYDPDRMGFGVLRVVNDDWIAPGAGFPTHSHQNMEIITIPLVGILAHQDDAGGKGEVGAGKVQVMSAGTGVLHSEFNASKAEPVELFQIWIEPKSYHVAPRYQETEYSRQVEKTGSALLVGPEGKSDTWIHQDAYISRINVVADEEYTYPLYIPGNGVYLLVIEGEGAILGHDLQKRDGLEVREETNVVIRATKTMDILCIEVPLV